MQKSHSCFTKKRSYVFVFFFLLFSGYHSFSELTDYKKTVFEKSASLYSKMQLDSQGLNSDVFTKAYAGWKQLHDTLGLNGILSIADFSQSANAKRLYVIDMENQQLLYHTYVAHGRNSGDEFAKSFSNFPESYKSSPGFYATGNPYNGKHGLSLPLIGLEKGVNDMAEKRSIVIHGADYVSESFIEKHGRLGRSLGCPAVPVELSKPIIETLKNGSCFFIYSPLAVKS